MKIKNSQIGFLGAIILLIATFSCKYYVDPGFRETHSIIESANNHQAKTSYFKFHFKNGNASILNEWEVNSTEDSVNGVGYLFDFNRNQIKDGKLSFGIDEIAIIESNDLEKLKSKDKGRLTALTILTAVNVAGSVICITNPKACFGSCPTFYISENKTLHNSNAEGFSSSIAPSLERIDIDALQYNTAIEDLRLTMKNEAMETHMVNQVYLEIVQKRNHEFIYIDRHNNYYRTGRPEKPIQANAVNSDILSNIQKIDDLEYFTTTDSLDLFQKEEIFLEFNQQEDSQLGLVLNFRQTLLTTFLLYSALSYMGEDFGNYFAEIEKNKLIQKAYKRPMNKLGGIEVYYLNSHNKWVKVDEIHETGPIAKNLNIIPLPTITSNKVKIKLKLTKGNWRIDYVGIAEIQEKVKPEKIYVSEIETINGDQFENQILKADDADYLYSFPGNEFVLQFKLPPLENGLEHEIFLASKGYYLEWIRSEWLESKEPKKLKKMLLMDKNTWRDLAIEFKSVEDEMEEIFWNSKFTPNQ